MEKELEKEVEGYLEKQVTANGGWSAKFISVNLRGVPDRIISFPHTGPLFIELKRPGEKPRPQQVYRINEMRKYGCTVFVVDTKEKVDRLIEELMKSKHTQKRRQ